MEAKIDKKWELINIISNEYVGIYHKFALKCGLSDSEFYVLYYLFKEQEACTQKEICVYWSCSKQTIHSAIEKLAKKKYIFRTNGSEMQNGKGFLLTEDGQRFAEESIKKIMQIENEAFSSISEIELDKMIENFNKPLEVLKNRLLDF